MIVADIEKELGVYGMRGRFRDLEPLNPETSNKSYALYTSAAPVTPLGHFQVTVGTSAVGLPSIPAEARRVYLTPVGAPINFRDDGTNPTGSSGYPIPADTHFTYDVEPTATFKMIRASTATSDADVRVAYYG
jgi:hypothetical protein